MPDTTLMTVDITFVSYSLKGKNERIPIKCVWASTPENLNLVRALQEACAQQQSTYPEFSSVASVSVIVPYAPE